MLLIKFPKVFSVILLFLTLNGCYKKSNSAKIDIEFQLAQQSTITFSTFDPLTLEPKIDPNVVIDSVENTILLQLKSPVFGTLNIGEYAIPVYLHQGSDLRLKKIEEKEFIFEGKGAE